jgi:hypothetical protein
MIHRLRAAAMLAIAALVAAPVAARGADLEVTRLDGKPVRGPIVAVSAAAVTLGPEPWTEIAWTDVLDARAVQPPGPPSKAQPATSRDATLRVALSDGTECDAVPERSVDGDLVIRIAGGQPARVPIDAFVWIRRPAAPSAVLAKVDETWESLDRSDKPATEDVVIIAKGSEPVVLRGAIRRVDSTGLRMQWNQRELPIDWSRIAGVRFARPQRRGAPFLIRTRAGDVFAGRIQAGNGDEFSMRSTLFESLNLRWDDVEHLENRAAGAAFLSDYRPQTYEFDALFGPQREYALNRSLDGGPVRLGGREFARAIVMHSQSRLIYPLGERFNRFAATVGVLDDYPKGRAAVRLLGDGRVLWENNDVRGGQPPIEVLVDIRGIRSLTLSVEYGADLDLGDHVAWAQPRLIRE